MIPQFPNWKFPFFQGSIVLILNIPISKPLSEPFSEISGHTFKRPFVNADTKRLWALSWTTRPRVFCTRSRENCPPREIETSTNQRWPNVEQLPGNQRREKRNIYVFYRFLWDTCCEILIGRYVFWFYFINFKIYGNVKRTCSF